MLIYRRLKRACERVYTGTAFKLCDATSWAFKQIKKKHSKNSNICANNRKYSSIRELDRLEQFEDYRNIEGKTAVPTEIEKTERCQHDRARMQHTSPWQSRDSHKRPPVARKLQFDLNLLVKSLFNFAPRHHYVIKI